MKQEEKKLPKGPEEASERYAQFYEQDLSDANGNFVNGCGDLRAAFIAGAKWQKKLDDDGAAVRAAASDLAGKLEKYLKQDCTRFVLCQSLNNLKSLLP